MLFSQLDKRPFVRAGLEIFLGQKGLPLQFFGRRRHRYTRHRLPRSVRQRFHKVAEDATEYLWYADTWGHLLCAASTISDGFKSSRDPAQRAPDSFVEGR